MAEGDYDAALKALNEAGGSQPDPQAPVTDPLFPGLPEPERRVSYIDQLAGDIGLHVRNCPLELLRLYALLALTVGKHVTPENVHDAWSAWTAGERPGHPSLMWFSELPLEVQRLDEPYADAIRRVASSVELPAGEPVRGAEASGEAAASAEPQAEPAGPQATPRGRPARVEVKGFRDLGVVRVSESTLAGEPMLRAESANGAVAEFPASSLHFITWLPEGHPQPALTSGDPWAHDDEVYGGDDRSPF